MGIASATPQQEAYMRLGFHGASVRAARDRLFSDLRKTGFPLARREDARAVVSELVANSLRHARPLDDGTITVGWRTRTGTLRLAVTDGGSNSVPAQREPDDMALGGRGLRIVQSLARDWGVESKSDSTTVWAELDLH
ncbi:MAG: ATP-binding protein [Nocardioidaceae bacterium]